MTECRCDRGGAEFVSLRHPDTPTLRHLRSGEGECSMASIVKATKSAQAAAKPRILVVDDEQSLLELIDDVVGRSLPCSIVAARSITDAKKILATQPIELMLADVNLPDGNGTSLISALR